MSPSPTPIVGALAGGGALAPPPTGGTRRAYRPPTLSRLVAGDGTGGIGDLWDDDGFLLAQGTDVGFTYS